MRIILVVLQLLFGNLLTKANRYPDTDPQRVAVFVAASLYEATDRVPASLLVALAWAESRFRSDATPACGAMQVYPNDIYRPWSDCEVWRNDLVAGVHAGVVEIEMLLDDPQTRGDMRMALMYRACGGTFFAGTCAASKYRWVTEAMTRWRWLEAVGIGS